MKLLYYKIVFALYWLLFAVLSVFAAHSPGLVEDPELIPFPWLCLVIVWVGLAALVAMFYFILKPAFVGGSSSRIAIALALSAAMTGASILAIVPDMAGLGYMPYYFSVLTFLVMLLVSVLRLGRALWRRIAG